MDLKEEASRLGIKFFLLAYSNLNTDARVCLVTTEHIGYVQKNGLIFTPGMFFTFDINKCGFKLIPAVESFVQLPWKKEFAWIQCEVYFDGAPYSQCPRNALKRQVEKAETMGYVMMAGFEPEFMLFDAEGKNLADLKDSIQTLNLHESHSIMRNSKLLCEITETMDTLGWGPYQVFHEATNCQYEIGFGYSDALTISDRYFFFKFMIKELAEAHGCTVTFMPVPLKDLFCANGLHLNVSLWSVKDKVNLFPDDKDEELGISKLARHFIGGLLEHVRDSCAVLCPTVNSYKRVTAGCFAPSVISWGGNNKSLMVRVPCNERAEHRLADGGTNLHLALTLLLGAGLDGISRNIEPGNPFKTVACSNEGKLTKLPNNLFEALNLLKVSKFAEESLGREVVEGFVSLKMKEWLLYSSHLTEWEKKFYFNC